MSSNGFQKGDLAYWHNPKQDGSDYETIWEITRIRHVCTRRGAPSLWRLQVCVKWYAGPGMGFNREYEPSHDELEFVPPLVALALVAAAKYAVGRS